LPFLFIETSFGRLHPFLSFALIGDAKKMECLENIFKYVTNHATSLEETNIVQEKCARTRLRVCEVWQKSEFRRTRVERRRSEMHLLRLSCTQEDKATRCETRHR